ncbi:hypothetical protein Fot_22570 [Forsythia ovata]|uniref:Transmembrane protein n=1 Tax=Forsythia ovata TaxID=205694 RepID=A0ABD1UY36_9LAMI
MEVGLVVYKWEENGMISRNKWGVFCWVFGAAVGRFFCLLRGDLLGRFLAVKGGLGTVFLQQKLGENGWFKKSKRGLEVGSGAVFLYAWGDLSGRFLAVKVGRILESKKGKRMAGLWSGREGWNCG